MVCICIKFDLAFYYHLPWAANFKSLHKKVNNHLLSIKLLLEMDRWRNAFSIDNFKLSIAISFIVGYLHRIIKISLPNCKLPKYFPWHTFEFVDIIFHAIIIILLFYYFIIMIIIIIITIPFCALSKNWQVIDSWIINFVYVAWA